jgi:glutaredoxin
MYIVLGRPNCPFCDRVKELLDEKGKDYRYIDVLSEGNEQFLNLLRDNNEKTVPQVFKLQPGGYKNLYFNLIMDERERNG